MATPKEQHDARPGARNVGAGDPRTPSDHGTERRGDAGPPAERDAARVRPEPVTLDDAGTE